jgi:hypothetical protein
LGSHSCPFPHKRYRWIHERHVPFRRQTGQSPRIRAAPSQRRVKLDLVRRDPGLMPEEIEERDFR